MNQCPKCGYIRKPTDTGSDLECPSCGVIYAKYNPEATLQARRHVTLNRIQSKQADRKRFREAGLWAGVAVILGGLYFFTSEYAPASSRSADRCADEGHAYVMANNFVQRGLKAPDSAIFPAPNAPGVSAIYTGDCTHVITGYVDAINSFGARLRTPYLATVRYDMSTEKWHLVQLSM